MSDRPAQRPEGELIKKAMGQRSAAELAAKIGISSARWRHIVNGYQPIGQGNAIEIVGPSTTLARMAAAVGITAEQLEGAGRSDAAEALRSMGRLGAEPTQPKVADRAASTPSNITIDQVAAEIERIRNLDLPATTRLRLITPLVDLAEELAAEQSGQRRAG